MKRILISFCALGATLALSGCMGGGVGGAAAQAVAGSAATGAITSGQNRARFQRQDCETLQREIQGAQRAMINPLTIPSTQAYIRDARAVATQKNCAFVMEAAADAATDA